jgi:hypothetical protein
MSETIDRNKYLDFEGLKKYDELIKGYIALGNESFASASDVSSLKIDVDALKSIDHNAYIAADTELENSLKVYVNDKVDLKQNVISDLETIRSGASAGATALQEVPEEYITENELSEKKYATESQVEDLIDSAVITASNDDIDELFK